MATTGQGMTQRHDGRMRKLHIDDGQIQAVPLGSPLGDDADTVPDASDGLLSPDLRRNFIIPPRERALECIAALLSLARNNLGTSQRNLHASRRAENDKEFAHWKWESLHWLRRCGKWSNHKRRVESS
jgi:hypothetical protein